MNQLLVSHKPGFIYDGVQTLTPTGGTGFTWHTLGSGTDIDQPFSNTTSNIGRVVVPINPVGAGADVIVSLYSDNAGKPFLSQGPLVQTIIPASVLTQLAAPNGVGPNPPALEPNTATPVLAPANYNTYFCSGGTTLNTWNAPAGSLNGFFASAATMTSNNFFVVSGGWDSTASAPVAGTISVEYLGNRQVAAPMNQPPLPKAVAGNAMTAVGAYAVVTGGTTTLSNAVNNVWVAGWDNANGIIGQWSAQAGLPTAVNFHGMASSGNFVYVIGGTNNSGLPVNNVQRATLSNGQISSWVQDNPLPVSASGIYAAVVGNWLIVCGDFGTTDTSIHYAAINSDGSIGAWHTTPNSLLTQIGSAGGSNQPGNGVVTTDSALITVGGATGAFPVPTDMIQPITASSFGVSNTSFQYHLNSPDATSGAQLAGAFAVGDGTWDLIGLEPATSNFWATTLVPVPMISVPMYVVGLNAAPSPYHILIQSQQGATASDYVQIGTLDNSALPTAAQTAPRHSTAFTTLTGQAIPISIFDASIPSHGVVRHTFEDVNAYQQPTQHTTLLYNNQSLLYGATTAVLKPNNPLNSNPTFTTGTSPWIVINGTLTQSNAQTHGGFPFSGLLTPTGGNQLAYIESEYLPVHQSNYGTDMWYYVNGWFYTPTTRTDFSLSVNWFDTSGIYLQTSSSIITLPGATWTFVQNNFQPPVTAGYARIAPTFSSTPGPANTLYCSNVFMIKSLETVGAFATAAQITYAGYPNTWPPTGVTSLI